MRRPRRQGALRIALVAPLVLAALVAREAAAFGEKLPWGERDERGETCRWLSWLLHTTTTSRRGTQARGAGPRDAAARAGRVKGVQKMHAGDGRP